MAVRFSVPIAGGESVGALDYPADGRAAAAGTNVVPETTLVLAHGAGAPQTHPFMTAFARGLSSRGIGYPLHPPGRPQKLRAEHLQAIAAPMLFVQGSRDAFGAPDELRPVLAGCTAAELLVVDGGDHSFKFRGKDAPTETHIHTAVQDAIRDWIGRRQ